MYCKYKENPCKMDPYELLVNRIEQLECKLGFPPEEFNEKTIVEDLLSAESVLSSATSGREKIVEINKRLEELNNYLDPQYVHQINEAKLKTNYVITTEPSIRQYCQCIQLCEEKSWVLNSTPLFNIFDLTASLEKIKADNVKSKEQCDDVEMSVQKAMETYNQTSMKIMENLAAISKKIDVMEKSKSK